MSFTISSIPKEIMVLVKQWVVAQHNEQGQALTVQDLKDRLNAHPSIRENAEYMEVLDTLVKNSSPETPVLLDPLVGHLFAPRLERGRWVQELLF